MGKIVIFSLAMMISLLIHHGAFFLLSDADGNKKAEKIRPVLEKQAMKMEIPPRMEVAPPSPPPKKKENAELAKRIEPTPASQRKQMEKLGLSMMEKARNGEFPPLTIRYSDPVKYLDQMLQLGAALALFDENTQQVWPIAVPSWKIAKPYDLQMLDKFSPFKRVVTDNIFDTRRADLSAFIGNTAANTQLLLLVPVIVEAQWMGQQLQVFKKKGVPFESVASVDAVFSNGNLEIQRLVLHDGTVKSVNG